MPPKRKSTTESQIVAKTGKKGGPIPDTKHKVNDVVLCKYGATFYEAKVLAIDPDEGYFIHYQGWNKRYDGFVGFLESNTRFKPYTEEEAKKVKEAKTAVKERPITPKVVKPKSAPKKDRSRNTSSEDDKSSKEAPTSKPRISSRTAEKTKPDVDVVRTPRAKKDDNNHNGSSIATIPKKKLEAPIKFESGTKLIGPDLAEILTDEQEMITRRYRLPKTPAAKTVYDLIEDYCNDNHVNLIKVEKMMEFSKTKNLAEPTNITRADCCAGLLNLFEVCVSSVLIYPFEREHIKTFTMEQSEGEDEEKVLRLSRFLGVTYLLRMLSRIHEILEKTEIPEDNAKTVMEVCTGITKHLNGHLLSYFDQTSYYVQPASDYIRRNSNLS